MKTKYYLILPTEEVTDKIIKDCVQTSRKTLKKSNDGKKCFLKYVDGKPASLRIYTETLTGGEAVARIDNKLLGWEDITFINKYLTPIRERS